MATKREMTIDLTGINSVNEFYTEHYLATYFEQSVSEAVQSWKKQAKDAEDRTPNQKLRDAARLYDRAFRHGQQRASNEDARELITAYLVALGYPEPRVDQIQLPTGAFIPLFAEYLDEKEMPRVWVITCHPEGDEDLLAARPQDLSADDEVAPCGVSCEEALDTLLLDVDNPARFVILASDTELMLIDRNKWSEKRYLSFDMEEIFRRREESTFQAMAVLLAHTSLCPAEGDTLIDNLDRQAREHASEVSDSLRYALRECVELLGNEVIHDWIHNKGRDLDAEPIDAGELTIECLRYMYRMLFLLFMEARPELGFAPMKSEAYLKSYSLESIRALAESHRDGIDTAADDTDYIDRTLSIACDIVYDGYPESDAESRQLLSSESINDVFLIPPLKAHIFDKQRTLLIDNARLRDSVMLRVIDRMSYTRHSKGSSERVSYGTLGINQLGGVYEALLSYRGFIAGERLYEVKRAKDKFDELDVGYFVTEAELGTYSEDERVRYESGPHKGELRTYEKGRFIYRLAGREREQSASYYTPESLTQCLVKYALKELLRGKSADDILQLTICEPAMGSAAFLNEAVNQLAEAYLERKQKELGQTIPSERRQFELQRVKMFIADRNVYGIDLNPIAVELGEVSLWLNTISQDGYVPWFGNQLHCGNSLIGARRQGYTEKDLTSKAKGIRWYDHEPERVSFTTGCSKSHRVYHFLVGDPGMASYKDKVVKGLEPDAIKQITAWSKAFVKPYQQAEIRSLRELSYEIDHLWSQQMEQQRMLREHTLDHLDCYGYEDVAAGSRTSIREKDRLLSMFYRSEHAKNAGPYARLKFAMDYWCALWFWPIDQWELLPTRDEFLLHMSFILVGTTDKVKGVRSTASPQMSLDLGEEFQTPEQLEIQELEDEFGMDKVVDLDDLCDKFPTLALVRQIAERQRFFHWELEFADVFDARGGFDLLLGNPPWIKLEWNEKDVLSDDDPRFAVHSPSAAETARLRGAALQNPAAYETYLDQYVRMTGQKSFLNAVQNYPLLKGQQTNLYKCFLPQAWTFTEEKGISAFVHPDGVFNDPKATALRAVCDLRLRTHFQFVNELKMFAGVHHHTVFSLNTYGDVRNEPSFDSISNLYTPTTIEECYGSDGSGAIPGVKTTDGNWETKGHQARVVHIGANELRTFAKLLGDSDWLGARILTVHAEQLMETLVCISEQPITLRSSNVSVFSSQCWHETNGIKDRTIKSIVGFIDSINESILSGPHIGVANPLYQTTRAIYRNNSDYDPINLESIPEDYLVRTKYQRVPERLEYERRMPKSAQDEAFDQFYRVVFRDMVGCSSERTLQAGIASPGQMWIHKLLGAYVSTSEMWINKNRTSRYRLLSWMAGCMASLPIDYVVRAIGKGDLTVDNIYSIPVIDTPLFDEIACRAILLNCLTRDYADLWRDVWDSKFAAYTWAKDDPRLPASTFATLTDEWRWETPLRKDYERRQALVELDVLVSLALGLTLEQLITVYELDFSVLQSYERETWYDVNGRVVCSRKAMGNFKYKPTEFKNAFGRSVNDCTSGVYPKTYIDDTLPGGPVERTIEYVAPFDTCDRVEDYRTAWEFFSKKYGLGKG